MVIGMDKLKKHFAGFEKSFAIIGGAACDMWFSLEYGRSFRPTKDIDMVLIFEALQPDFLAKLKEFVKDGGYVPYICKDGHKTYYRFVEPLTPDYPKMIEIFSTRPIDLSLIPGQRIIPVEDKLRSLSAILMDDDYHEIVVSLRKTIDGIPVILPTGLIALKAKAWLDLNSRKDSGSVVDERDIKKHRNDIFRLAELLEEGYATSVPGKVLSDINNFLSAIEEQSSEWPSILQSLGLKGDKIIGSRITSIRNHFATSQ